ncbi:cytochrome b/b6 domain-containing protein [Pseudomonas sp. NPDC007930]|uniref:cytochrome b n=1 Tax=Pseudomonas sp. NPDC007930 TaxID=3364417 RepID=UPI0036E1B3C1
MTTIPLSAAAPARRYATLSITLHWLTVLLFIALYACIELKGYVPRGTPLRAALVGGHGIFGVSIFLLVWLRLLARKLYAAPPIEPRPPRWQTGLAHATHSLLYLLMIVPPVLAWLMLALAGKPFPWLGFELPSPMAQDPDLAKTLKAVHEWIGNAGYWLIGLHALAGLFHHYVVRDNTLKRMLPGRREG